MTNEPADDDDIENTLFICASCVGEAYLSDQIQKQGQTKQCEFCGNTGHAWSIGELADAVEAAFEQHYDRTSDQPTSMEYMMLSDRESSYDWERHGEPVVDAIESAAEIPRDAAEWVQATLADRHADFDQDAMGEETEFAEDSHYEERRTDDRRWQEDWHEFQRSLKTQARFFNKRATSHLGQIFNDIDKLKTTSGKPIIVEAGANTELTHLFRARAFQSDDLIEQALIKASDALGSPPSNVAMPGRMNAHGISVFYGANQQLVALAEVRPPVGAQVAVGRFDIIRPLRLLDLNALDDIASEAGSIFDPSWNERLERTKFLQTLRARLTRAVMPGDEALDYLATQAVAEFLAASDLNIDGIIYPSVQVVENAFNVVLFHKAALVERRKLAARTKTTASTGQSTEDGWETEYSIWEHTPAAKPKNTRPVPFDFDDDTDPYSRYEDDGRTPALRLDMSAIEVHIVQHVTFATQPHVVQHHTWTDPAPKSEPTEGAEDFTSKM